MKIDNVDNDIFGFHFSGVHKLNKYNEKTYIDMLMTSFLFFSDYKFFSFWIPAQET